MKLIATRPMRYRTRRLQAGDEFEEPNDVFARVLVMRKRAEYAPGKPAPEKSAVETKTRPYDSAEYLNTDEARAEYERDQLREEAEALGVDVDGRWGVVRLQAEIARAKL